MLIRQGRIHDFYNSREWRRLAHEVIAEQHCECQICKARGRYRRAEIAHHVKHVKRHPELAYCKTFTDENGVEHKQILAVCWDCHEEEHPEKKKYRDEKRKFRNTEQW